MEDQDYEKQVATANRVLGDMANEAMEQANAEGQILALKADIFDFLEAQEQLNNQMQQIEQLKQQKIAELNSLRAG